MKQIAQTGQMTSCLMLLIPLIVIGCSSPADDERLVDLARDAMDQQRKQNQVIADQSKRIVDESEKLTEAARDLVARDAQARREMIEAQVALNSDLHNERSSIDRQREEMEQDRRQIATQRHRDPVIAESIKVIGAWIACLAPLALAAYLLLHLRTDTPDDHAVAELLVSELTADQPRLLPISLQPIVAIEDKAGDHVQEEQAETD